MKRSILKLCLSAGALIISANALVAQLTVDIYAGVSTSAGGGAPYFGLVGSFTSPDINFPNVFDPLSLGVFGADINGGLQVAADGNYTFTLDSDDGSLLFIDGNLAVDNGGPHSPNTASGTEFLTAGNHSIEVQYYEAFGYPAELILSLPDGVSYGSSTGSVPDGGSTFAGLAFAAALLGLVNRKRKTLSP